MSYAKEREEFISRFREEFPDRSREECLHAARLLLRHSKTHGRLAVESCNGHPLQGISPPIGCDMKEYNARISKAQDRWDARIEKKEKQIEARMMEICKPFNLPVTFGGDPRGYTVKVKFPSGRYNTWGGSEDGWGVPQ